MFEVDEAIVEALFHKDLYYRELYDKANEICKREIADAVFDSSLKRLQERNNIVRDVEIQGRPRTKYKLSERARQEHQFEILELRTSKKRKSTHQKKIATNDIQSEKIKREQMYHLLFFLGTIHQPIYELRTENSLQEFLSRIGISRDDLCISEDNVLRATFSSGLWPYNIYVRIDETVSALPVTSITPPYHLFITRYESPRLGLTIWKERYKHFEYDNEDTFRPELEKLRGRLRELKASNIVLELYRYTVSGIGVSDLLNQKDRLVFKHINLSKELVQRAFDLLQEKGLIKASFESPLQETRYVIADEELAKVIASCWELFNTILEMQVITWAYIRKRSDAEREWLSTFYGSKTADDLFRNYYYYRKNPPEANKEEGFQQRVQERVRSLRTKAITDVKEIKIKYAIIIEKYHFPLDSLTNLIFPSWLQEEKK